MSEKEYAMKGGGINIGYGYLKMRTDAEYFQIASVVEKAVRGHMGTMGAVRETVAVVVDNATYEIGADAHLISTTQNTSKSVSDFWYDTVQYQALKQLVIDRLAEESEDEDEKWVVTLGIAVNQYKRPQIRKQLAEIWKRAHETSDGKQLIIDTVMVVPEPLGAYTSFIAKDEEKYKGLRIMVLDPGYRTTDWLEIRDGKVIDRHADAINIGMFDVYNEIARRINIDHDAGMDIVAIEQAVLLDREMRVRGNDIKVKEYYEAAVKAVGAKIESRIRTEIGAANETDLVIVAGGGADSMFDSVKKSFKKHTVEICESPQEANAVGYWLMSNRVAQRHAAA